MTYINHEVWAMLQLGSEMFQIFTSLLAGIVIGYRVRHDTAAWWCITIGIGVIGLILVPTIIYDQWLLYHDWVQPVRFTPAPVPIIAWLQTRNFGLLASIEWIAAVSLSFLVAILGMWLGKKCPAKGWFVLGMTTLAGLMMIMSVVVMYKWFSHPVNLAIPYRPDMVGHEWAEWYSDFTCEGR